MVHLIEITVLEIVSEGHVVGRHLLGRPALHEGVRHWVGLDEGENDLYYAETTTGMLARTLSEQHSQLMSWLQTMLRKYWFDSSFPEHVGLMFPCGIRN